MEHRIELWLIDLIEKAAARCMERRCISFDFGANVGLFSLLLQSRGFIVVSVEPQLDLCCALHTALGQSDSPHLTLCGGVKPSSSKTETIMVTGGYRYGSESAEVSQFTAFGLPTPSVVPLYPLKDIVGLISEAGKEHIDFMKIDTDSGDCHLARELLDNNVSFTTATIEFADCTAGIVAPLLADLQVREYHVYLASPAVSKSCLVPRTPNKCEEEREAFIAGASTKNIFVHTVSLGGANWFVGKLMKKTGDEWQSYLKTDPHLLESYESFATKLEL